MKYTLILPILAGASSALISGGPFYQSFRHFAIFMIFMVFAMIVGTYMDTH